MLIYQKILKNITIFFKINRFGGYIVHIDRSQCRLFLAKVLVEDPLIRHDLIELDEDKLLVLDKGQLEEIWFEDEEEEVSKYFGQCLI